MNKLVANFNLIKSFFDHNQVSYLILYVTNRCNFKCGFCFYHTEIEKGRKKEELKLEEIRKISENAGPVIQLSITGGEPFLREDLAEITGFFVKNNFVKYVTIPTNASLTVRMTDYLDNVLPAYPRTYFRVVFSIDGVGEIHDNRRSAPGSYGKILESYEAVSHMRKRYPNMVLDSNTVFATDSQDTILDTIKTIRQDFDFDNISLTYVRGDIKDSSLKKTYFQKYVEVNSYLEKMKRKKEKRFLYPLWRAVRDVSREYMIETVLKGRFITPCTAGKKILIISETGEVYPCEMLNRSMGNLRDVDFDMKLLLSRAENRELLKWIKDSRCKCSFECALAANVLWGKAPRFKLLKAAVRNIGRDGKN